MPATASLAGAADAVRLARVLHERLALRDVRLDLLGAGASAVEWNKQRIDLLLGLGHAELAVRDRLDRECKALALRILGAAVCGPRLADRGLVLTERELARGFEIVRAELLLKRCIAFRHRPLIGDGLVLAGARGTTNGRARRRGHHRA